LSQITRVTDRRTDGRTDGRTDRNLITIPRLHYMQRGKNEFDMYLMASKTRKRLIAAEVHGIQLVESSGTVN